MATLHHVFYVQGFPDLKEDTPITIMIPKNAGSHFSVEVEIPVEALTDPNRIPVSNTVTVSNVPARPPSPTQPLQLPFKPKLQLGPPQQSSPSRPPPPSPFAPQLQVGPVRTGFQPNVGAGEIVKAAN